MFRKVFILASLVAICQCLPSIPSLRELINKNLDFLLEQHDINANATYALAWGVAEFHILDHNMGPLNASIQDVIDELKPKYDFFIDKILEENPDDHDIQLLYHPELYDLTGQFKFIPGRLPKNPPPLRMTLEEIYKKTIGNARTEECYTKMMENGGSDELRQCTLDCQEEMKDTKASSPISFDQRISYLTISAFLNCSNVPPSEIMSIVNEDCKIIGRQIKTMYDHRTEPFFNQIRSLYLDKLLLCGTYGFPEIYVEEYIKEIMKSVNEDGSVGTDANTEEEKEVLTAQTAAILTSAIRAQLESNYKKC